MHRAERRKPNLWVLGADFKRVDPVGDEETLGSVGRSGVVVAVVRVLLTDSEKGRGEPPYPRVLPRLDRVCLGGGDMVDDVMLLSVAVELARVDVGDGDNVQDVRRVFLHDHKQVRHDVTTS
eukprot:CAMPEP_0175944254 /NCGR_PEP_ID=MMETSP0108-20121206/26004_1 /TAXON_ID=195067 ORGANISM="Goniomonas pacifica, Strain CCMP1869" /NCGR_SAMPLE_ID=MMETSP0108 /ASSEMBLY_ACC=CAM_ASM_000204 /LENGTH=121 /DNA_ID=CAMNT_0017269305 /DNA_START=144 /DNA_END=509 /DNA_ORIENTATION=+